MNEPATFLDTLPRIMLYTGTWIAGSVFIRRYAEYGAPGDFAASIAASAFGMVLAVPLLKTAGLGITMGITSALYLMAMAAVGALVFGERIMPVQSAGIALAGIAVLLMALPTQNHDTAPQQPPMQHNGDQTNE